MTEYGRRCPSSFCKRRQVTLSVPACTTTAVSADNARLPKNKSEGDMPLIAIATGMVDPIECLLLKIGIDSAEITGPAASGAPGAGHVSFFQATDAPGTNMSGSLSASSLYPNLQSYDIVIMPCEGHPFDKSPNQSKFVDYLNMGGRLFASHYSYDWLAYPGTMGMPPATGGSPFNVVGTWNLDQTPPIPIFGPYLGTIDTSFPKGMAFQQWMKNVGVTVPFPIVDPRNDLDAVNPMYAQRWVYHSGDNKIQHMTFNTPLNAPIGPDNLPQYCGRAVYSDFHVSAMAATLQGSFPNACTGYPNLTPMTDQEKALTFMLFDLSSCVQPDSVPPMPPPIG